MSDLISREALISHIKKEYCQCNGEYCAEQILHDIKDFPSAFNLNNVVMKLEEMIDPNVDFDTGVPCDNWVVDMQNELIVKCIEIVQKCGID